ncbi:hypothetical protein [Streptomyces sp. ME19-01-6]|uniref:hypothetical protein n=1 Tax=Streptomyces sp. ME19-01-6 TaxID=3028686 RepID=UPI0029A9948F|nr:hypothetical protein [Streptomyces sp. ME19-01-6]MDX3232927.1 hypothetical protein [Streptomyces sp. ME19-01-6]
MGDSRTKFTPEVGVPRPGDTPTHTPEIERLSDYSAEQAGLVRGAAQELEHTASRRTGPRRWLRAVVWLIAAGLHPRANATTLLLAEDLAMRMNYDTGHAIYDLDGTAARLGIHRATVKRHAKYLRELGALVWASHGTQHNSRRARGLTGYAGTATMYAATIPPSFDHAMGHRLIGSGYTARIVVDQRRQQTVSSTLKPVDNSTPSEGRAPLSLTVVKEEGQVQVEGGFTTTEQARAANSIQPPRTKKPTILGRTVTAAAAQQADRIARWIRPLVNWLQTASHRQLSWSLVDPVLDGRDEQDILAWLSAMGRTTRDGHTWRPAKPHRVIAAALRAEQQQPGPRAMSPAEWDAYHQQRAAEQRALEEQRAAEMAARTDQERREAHAAAQFDLGIVADHITEYGEDDAVDLYGAWLTARADRLRTSAHYRMGA